MTNTTIRVVWKLAHKHYKEHKHMNSALVDQFLKLIPEANWHTFKESQLMVDPKMPFLHNFDYFW